VGHISLNISMEKSFFEKPKVAEPAKKLPSLHESIMGEFTLINEIVCIAHNICNSYLNSSRHIISVLPFKKIDLIRVSDKFS
jgi:hypothetical protein